MHKIHDQAAWISIVYLMIGLRFISVIGFVLINALLLNNLIVELIVGLKFNWDSHTLKKRFPVVAQHEILFRDPVLCDDDDC